ncbi:MAG: enoyl-CoA hydratase/isomerase family protein [Candidatus Caldarchaeum sp.]
MSSAEGWGLTSSFKTIKLVAGERASTIILSRPPLNIMNIEMMDEFSNALEDLAANKQLAVLIVKSGVEGVFSAGADVREHLPEMAEQLIRKFESLILKLLSFPTPTVCVVDGKCLGGGMELAMACDFVIASEAAEFGQPEVKVGVFPPAAAALYLRLTSLKNVYTLLMAGKTVKAAEAKQMGLVNEVVEKQQLEVFLSSFTEQLLANSSAVMRHAKKAILSSLTLPFEQALTKASDIYLNELMRTEDAVEGLKAFLEKRKPVWRDK